MLEKSRTGKPSPHVDPKPRKRMTADQMRDLYSKYLKPKNKKDRKLGGMKPKKPTFKAMKKVLKAI